MRIKAYAIQARFDPHDYTSTETFKRKIEELMSKADSTEKLDRKSLVVFPEDIGTFLVFLDEDLEKVESVEEAVKNVLMRNFPKLLFLMLSKKLSPKKALLTVKWKKVWNTYRATFAKFAREYHTYIVAGSLLEPQKRRIYNTSYLFGPDGWIIGKQSKVHLVEIEKALGVDPASIESIRVYETEVGRIGITICFDGFHNDVVRRITRLGANIMAQPSANPEPWNERLEKEWRTGAWKMVQEYKELEIGINPMAVGRFFDLVFEGISSIVAKKERTPDGSGYLARAISWFKEEVVFSEYIFEEG